MRTTRQFLVIAAMFLAVPLLALTLVPTVPAGYRAYSVQNDPASPFLYIILVLVMTGLLLILIKRSKTGLVKALLFMAFGLGMFSICSLMAMLGGLDEVASLGIGIAASSVILSLLLWRPRWYVVNMSGMFLGVGVALVLGISLGILPSLILLTVLAIYDALSVYVTKHMLTLAEGVAGLGLPIVLIVPGPQGAGNIELNLHDRSKDSDREVMLMGLGDVIIPSVLIVSAAANLPPVNSAGWGSPALMVALLTLTAVMVGFLSLMLLISKGRPQAGLPFLNGSAIIGYAIAYLIVYQDLGFGFA